MLSVIIGVWAGTFLMAFYMGVTDDRITNAIETEISHIQIHHTEFKKEYDIKYDIPRGSEILQKISGNKNVKSAAGRIVTFGMISAPAGSSGIKLNGIMPSAENNTTKLNSKITKGEYFNEKTPNSIIISEKLTEKLKVKLKSKVVITFEDSQSNIITGAFRIIGLYKTYNTPYDEMNIFVSIEDINTLLESKDGINEIAVLLHDNKSMDIVKNELKNEYSDLQIENWTEISPELNLILTTVQQYMDILMAIIMLALAFGVINIMLMTVLERKNELGMLMAIGMSKSRVFVMILFETIILVFTGCPPGSLLSYLTISYFGDKGINLSVFSDAYSSFGFSSMAYPKLEFEYYIRIALFVMTMAIISSVFPARKALKLRPAETIRKQ